MFDVYQGDWILNIHFYTYSHPRGVLRAKQNWDVSFCAVQNMATIEFKLVYANSLLKLEWHFYPWKDHVNQGSRSNFQTLIL